MISRLLLSLLVVGASSPTYAYGPVPVTCIRDKKEDPEQIRTLFGQLDRMAVRELNAAGVRFYSTDHGFVPLDQFVLRSNFRHGREDAAPLRVSGIRLLSFSGKVRPNAFYVVGTTRSVWFDRGTDSNSSYEDLNETWLVGFSGCTIDSVHEMPGLSYLIVAGPNG